uniref:Uncharacterized protein n=1 Tax=Arundo donax TaxID=35708 RepID=A0A0A9AIH5_ARUDO
MPDPLGRSGAPTRATGVVAQIFQVPSCIL